MQDLSIVRKGKINLTKHFKGEIIGSDFYFDEDEAHFIQFIWIDFEIQPYENALESSICIFFEYYDPHSCKNIIRISSEKKKHLARAHVVKKKKSM